MPEKKKHTTLKDIAKACGVSHTIVSAVLRNRKGRIAYSENTKEKVLKKAKELNYAPNLFARSMVSGKSSIVALCLHSKPEDMEGEFNYYLYDILPNVAFGLNKRGLEMLFMPFGSQNEQLTRLNALVGAKMVGGIISNIIPDSNSEVISYLRESEVPYMIMGYDLDESVYSSFVDSKNVRDSIMNFASKKKFKKTIKAGIFRKRWDFRAIPYCGNSQYSSKLLNEKELDFNDTDILFVAFGFSVAEELLKEFPVKEKNILIIDDKRRGHNPYSSS